MSDSDGYLRPGADAVHDGLESVDGLLTASGVTGGEPPTIRQSGTVVSVASFTAQATITDGGTAATAITASAVETICDEGVVTSTALLEQVQEGAATGTVISTADFAAEETISDEGTVSSVSSFSATQRVVEKTVVVEGAQAEIPAGDYPLRRTPRHPGPDHVRSTSRVRASSTSRVVARIQGESRVEVRIDGLVRRRPVRTRSGALVLSEWNVRSRGRFASSVAVASEERIARTTEGPVAEEELVLLLL